MQEELDGRYQGENVQFFGVSTGDPEWYLRELKKQWACEFPWGMLNINLPNTYYRERFDAYELEEEWPTLIVLDTNGVIRFRDYGGGPADKDLDYRAAFDFIGELLEEVKGE